MFFIDLIKCLIFSDPTLLQDVNEWGKAVKAYGEVVVGESYVWLNEECSMGECNLGNILQTSLN